MTNKLLIVLLGLIVIAVAVVLVAVLLNSDSLSQPNVSSKTLAIYKENCSRCNGLAGERFEDYPELKGNRLSLDEIKSVIREGRGDMPPFSNIREPFLTELSGYIDSF